MRKVASAKQLSEAFGVILVMGSIGFVWLDCRRAGEFETSVKRSFGSALDEYVALSNAAVGQPAVGTKHRGHIVVLDGDTGELHRAQYELRRYGLPKGIRARHPDDALTLAVISTEQERILTYEGGLTRRDGSTTRNIPVYRVDVVVTIVDLETEDVLATARFTGPGRSEFPPRAGVVEHRAVPRIELIGSERTIPVYVLRHDDGEPYGIAGVESNEMTALKWIGDMWAGS